MEGKRSGMAAIGSPRTEHLLLHPLWAEGLVFANHSSQYVLCFGIQAALHFPCHFALQLWACLRLGNCGRVWVWGGSMHLRKHVTNEVLHQKN